MTLKWLVERLATGEGEMIEQRTRIHQIYDWENWVYLTAEPAANSYILAVTALASDGKQLCRLCFLQYLVDPRKLSKKKKEIRQSNLA